MSVTIEVNKATLSKMISFYESKSITTKNPHALYVFKDENVTITVYKSMKVLFQGNNAEAEASMWGAMKKETKKTEKLLTKDLAGSDEVGTGDYFGPIVVVAALVREKDIEYLESLGINDSKKMKDDYILEIAEEVQNRITNVSFVLDNKKYNELIDNGFNLNKIKAVMHNQVMMKMKAENLNINGFIVDQFASEKNYYNYLKGSKNVVKVTLTEKAESKYLCVATASVIARYIFLQEIDKISAQLGESIIKGAGSKVDDQMMRLTETFGQAKMQNYVKWHFKNTKKALG